MVWASTPVRTQRSWQSHGTPVAASARDATDSGLEWPNRGAVAPGPKVVFWGCQPGTFVAAPHHNEHPHLQFGVGNPYVRVRKDFIHIFQASSFRRGHPRSPYKQPRGTLKW